MPKKKQITPESSVQDYTKLIGKRLACGEALDWCAAQHKGTMAELMEKFLSSKDAPESWAAWNLIAEGEHISPELRRGFIDKIQDPMAAFYIYTEMSWLTDEEDALLADKFKGKLPTAEAELVQGIVKREKIVNGCNSL